MSALDRELLATYRPPSNAREVEAIGGVRCKICKRPCYTGAVHAGRCTEMGDAIEALRDGPRSLG